MDVCESRGKSSRSSSKLQNLRPQQIALVEPEPELALPASPASCGSGMTMESLLEEPESVLEEEDGEQDTFLQEMLPEEKLLEELASYQKEWTEDSSNITLLADVQQKLHLADDADALLVDVEQKLHLSQRDQSPEMVELENSSSSVAMAMKTGVEGAAVDVKATVRPRWADLSDDEEDEVMLQFPPATQMFLEEREAAVEVRETGPAGGVQEKAYEAEGGKQGPAKARCGGCREMLGKESFSRRAWRQARGLGGAGMAGAIERGNALCRSCAPSS